MSVSISCWQQPIPTFGNIWVFPKMVVPQNGWFIVENLLKWMIWGYHHLRKHPYLSQRLNLRWPTGFRETKKHSNIDIDQIKKCHCFHQIQVLNWLWTSKIYSHFYAQHQNACNRKVSVWTTVLPMFSKQEFSATNWDWHSRNCRFQREPPVFCNSKDVTWHMFHVNIFWKEKLYDWHITMNMYVSAWLRIKWKLHLV